MKSHLRAHTQDCHFPVASSGMISYQLPPYHQGAAWKYRLSAPTPDLLDQTLWPSVPEQAFQVILKQARVEPQVFLSQTFKPILF